MLTVKKVFIFLNLETLAKHNSIEGATLVTDFDYRAYGNAAKGFVFLAEREVSYSLPDNVTEIAIGSMEDALAEMRAKHHAEQQAMIDRIAGLRQLAAPKEGEVLDDRDLRGKNCSTVKDADDAEYSDVDDFPF